MAEEEPKELALSANKKLRRIQLEEATAIKDSAVAAARKAAAEADAAAAEPEAEPESKAPKGTITLGDDVGLVADLVAHSMVDKAATVLSAEIKDAVNGSKPRILLVDSPDLLGSDWPYMAISNQITHEKKELEAARDQLLPAKAGEVQVEEAAQPTVAPLGALLPALPAVIGGVADVVSMFRGDYEIKARKVSIGTTPLFAALANRLIQDVETVNLEKLALLKESTLFDDFNTAAETRLEAQRLAADLKERKLAPFEWLKEQAKAAQGTYEEALKAKEPPGKDNLETLKAAASALRDEVRSEFAKVADAHAVVAVAEGAIERFDEFAAAITKAPESGYPPLIAAAVHEALHKQEGYTHVLYAALESAGGETITRQTIFRTTARFIGGAQVSYMLWDVTKGKLVAANTMPVLGNAKFGLATGFAGPVESVALKQE